MVIDRHGVVRVRRAVAVAIAGVMLASLGPVPAVGAASERFVVKAKAGDRWSPKHTYIGKGDRVVFRNPTNSTHDFQSTTGRWGPGGLYEELGKGDKVSFTFRKTGTYQYRCLLHSALVGKRCKGMCGFVHVFVK